MANGRPRSPGRKRPDSLEILAQTRPQDRLPDIAYVFAPLKHARLDYMVQKAVEMGASRLQPVLTRFTQVSRVNGERMRANVIEAAEQCGILSLAAVAEPMPLDRYLGERAAAAPAGVLRRGGGDRFPLEALQQAAAAADGIDVLIGPEGGFAEEERALLLRQPHTLRLALGPGSCGRIPPASRPWRWCRPRWATGPGPGSRWRPQPLRPPIKPIGTSLSHLADPCRNPAPAMLRPAPTNPLNLLEPVFPDIWTSK